MWSLFLCVAGGGADLEQVQGHGEHLIGRRKCPANTHARDAAADGL